MTDDLYLSTTSGLYTARRDGGAWHTIGYGLRRLTVTCVAFCQGLILAGTTEGIWRSLDGGQRWSEGNDGLEIRHVRSLTCFAKGEEFILAGTEPAGIFASRDRADTWFACPEVADLRNKHGWYLPYSPEAGCVRGFALAGSFSDQARIFAAVEVGGVLVSTDSGEKWQLVEGSDGNPATSRRFEKIIHPDVHSITVHPSSPDLVIASTGGGLYRSIDGGKTWICLYHCYCRAAWVDPADPEHIIFGPADGVSKNGRIEESRDEGQTWHPASTGMNTPWPYHMVERFVQVADELLAVLSNGELWSRQLEGIDWRRQLPRIDQITDVASTTGA